MSFHLKQAVMAYMKKYITFVYAHLHNWDAAIHQYSKMSRV